VVKHRQGQARQSGARLSKEIEGQIIAIACMACVVTPTSRWLMPVAVQNKITRSCALSVVVFAMGYPPPSYWRTRSLLRAARPFYQCFASLDLGSCIARFVSGNIADGDGIRQPGAALNSPGVSAGFAVRPMGRRRKYVGFIRTTNEHLTWRVARNRDPTSLCGGTARFR
jgi:hypothetical protein